MIATRLASRAVSKKGVGLVQKRNAFTSKWDDPHEAYSGTGGNLPFNVHCNRWVLLTKAFVFCATGFWLPFVSYHYLRTKQMR